MERPTVLKGTTRGQVPRRTVRHRLWIEPIWVTARSFALLEAGAVAVAVQTVEREEVVVTRQPAATAEQRLVDGSDPQDWVP